MNSVTMISEQVIKNLTSQNIEITPREYTEEFCKIAKQNNFKLEGCNYLNEISKLITLTDKYLADALHNSTQSSKNVSNIKGELKVIKIKDSINKDINTLYTKLVNTVNSIEDEMDTVHKNLMSSKNEVSSLQSKVKKLERELENSKIESSTDHLTGLLNRRSFEMKLDILDDLFKTSKKNYAIIFFDIDHFKDVNDTYGHEAGDIILKTFSALLLKLTKETDTLARYGGEEFIAIIEYTNLDGLNSYINRIKNVVNKNKFIYENQKIQITFSGGVELRSNHKTAKNTIKNADKLLYKAKQSGRNKIIFWNEKEI
jgi:diguanylate cyclase (GGDEF)-like protein